MTDRDPLAQHMSVVARALWGDPNPAHSKPGKPRWGNKGSLAVDEEIGVWFDHEAGEGGGVLAAIDRDKALTGAAAFEWMRANGCEVDDPRPKANGEKHPHSAAGPARPDAGKETRTDARKEILETHDYVDEVGALAFQVVRFGFRNGDGGLVTAKSGKPEKSFSQRRPDPDEQKVWIWGLGAGEYMRKVPGKDWYRFDEQRWAKLGAERERKTIAAAAKSVPYRLPELIEAVAGGHPVLIVEGEQKADLLAAWKLAATCNAQGAGKWTAGHAAYLHGAEVVILPDNDEAGREHAEAVARSLQGIAARIVRLELPGLKPKGDIIDWHNAGGTREKLDALIAPANEVPSQQQPKHQAPANGNRSLSAKELDSMRFEPIKYVVPGIIVEGLTLLAAKPKMGKSWMMLHAGVAVARGGVTLGDIHCVEGDVLYCALEDNLRRLQSRMTKLIGTQYEWPARLFFRCEMPRLAEGGLQVIKDWIKEVKEPRMVIIDTLAMVRMPKKLSESSYDADYNAVKELRALANEQGIAIVLVHHLRKQESDDAFDTVSGTLGLTGAPDTILVLRRDSGGSTVLHGRGRDLIEIEKAMTFNPDACTWTIAGELRDVTASNARKTIIAAMREIELPATPTEIAAGANMKRDNVRHLLPKMIDDGIIKKSDYGKYDLVANQK